jgi:hypothetical protein
MTYMMISLRTTTTNTTTTRTAAGAAAATTFQGLQQKKPTATITEDKAG